MGLVVQTVDSAIHWINIRKINCVIYWIEIYIYWIALSNERLGPGEKMTSLLLMTNPLISSRLEQIGARIKYAVQSKKDIILKKSEMFKVKTNFGMVNISAIYFRKKRKLEKNIITVAL